MIKTVAVLGVELALGIGAAPLIRLWVPLVHQGMRFVLRLGSKAIMKEFATLGMRLIVVYLIAEQENLVNDSSAIAMKIFEEAVRRKKGSRRKEKMATTVSNILIHGLNKITRSGYEGKARSVLDFWVTSFESAVERNDRKNAECLLEVGMTLLVSTIEEDAAERTRSFTADYLLKSWVRELDRAATNRRPLAQTLLNIKANDLNEAIRRGNATCPMVLKTWMEVLRVAIVEKRVDISKMLSSTVAEALSRALSENRREAVNSVLRETAAGVVQAIRDKNEPEVKVIFEVRQELMMAAIERKAGQLVALLSESWLVELDRAAHECSSEAVGRLIDESAATFFEVIRDDNREANLMWGVSIEVLLTAIRLEKEELAKRLSTSYVNALAEARAWFDEGLVNSLVYQCVAALREAINSHDDARAHTLSQAALELLLAAVNLANPLLVKDLSRAWIVALGVVGDGRHPGTGETLIGTRAEVFRKAIMEGKVDNIKVLSTVGLELLLAAISDGKDATTRNISKSWIIALADTIDQGHKQTVDNLIRTQMDVFHKTISENNLGEAERLVIAATELCFAAIRESKVTLVESLSRVLAWALSAVIKEDREMADRLVKKTRERFDTAVVLNNKEEMDMLSIAAKRTLRAANDLQNPVMAMFLQRPEAWGPLIQRPE